MKRRSEAKERMVEAEEGGKGCGMRRDEERGEIYGRGESMKGRIEGRKGKEGRGRSGENEAE